MVKIRLRGLPDELEKAKEALRHNFNVLYESDTYPDRNSQYFRLYIEAQVKGDTEDGKGRN